MMCLERRSLEPPDPGARPWATDVVRQYIDSERARRLLCGTERKSEAHSVVRVERTRNPGTRRRQSVFITVGMSSSSGTALLSVRGTLARGAWFDALSEARTGLTNFL